MKLVQLPTPDVYIKKKVVCDVTALAELPEKKTRITCLRCRGEIQILAERGTICRYIIC